MATLLSEVPVRACLCGDIYVEDHKFFMDVCQSNVCCETFFADGSVNKKNYTSFFLLLSLKFVQPFVGVGQNAEISLN